MWPTTLHSIQYYVGQYEWSHAGFLFSYKLPLPV